MEKRKEETTLSHQAFCRNKMSDKFSLRKQQIQNMLITKRLKNYKGPSQYQIDISKLNVPEQFFRVENLHENFGYLLELLNKEEVDVIKFVVVTIRKLTMEEMDFDGTINVQWVNKLLEYDSDHLDQIDLLVRLIFLILF
ncbi:MAG: hypothetical protein MJ252_13435 [archaeon]|nr:hypothetical protein [archaeon]